MFNNEDLKMKLQELAVANPIKQAARVFETHFGNRVDFERLTGAQARGMLRRVRAALAEHRQTRAFHASEHDPAYLKLIVMEQALSAVSATPAANPQQQATDMAAQRQQKQRALDDEDRLLTKQSQDIVARKSAIQKEKNMRETGRSLKSRLQEASEVQQAQVVLASQDLVDQVQSMSEDVSAMQFKDLPALIDNIKNEVGVDQAQQFNTDATAALTGLLQNLQAAKQQLETALGVVTGQAPVVPGADMTAAMPAELPQPEPEEIDVTDVEIDEPASTGLGRDRR
jgi:hypothetical protein